MTVATTAFALNLRSRILARAGIDSAEMPASGLAIVDARVAGLVNTRQVNEESVERIANAIQRQFKKLVKIPPGDRPQHATTSPPPPVIMSRAQHEHHSQRRSDSAAPADSSGASKPVGAARRERSMLPTTTSKSTTPTIGKHNRRHVKPSTVVNATTPDVADTLYRLRAEALGSPVRLAVRRKRQLAAADAEFEERSMSEMQLQSVYDSQQTERGQAFREQMKLEMQQHARREAEKREEERQDRERRRADVLAEQEAIRMEDAIERQRRRVKFQQEKAEIEQQRERIRKRHEVAKATEAIENAKIREATAAGLVEDEKLAKARAQATRAAMEGFLKESQETQAEKRRLQQEERQKTLDMLRRHDNILPGGNPGGNHLNSVQMQKIGQRKAQQDAVMESHAKQYAIARERVEREEREAIEAERKTVEDRARRNAEDAARARKMRAELVSSLDLEISIHKQREGKAVEQTAKDRQVVAAAVAEAEEAIKADAMKHRERQVELREALRQQVDVREVDFESNIPKIKVSTRPDRFLHRNPMA